MTAELLKLAERVESLTGADREIDGLIACAIFKTIKTDDDLIYRVPICKADECAPGTYWHVSRSGRCLQTAPSYTSSLDAAMSLVPEGWWWSGGVCKRENHASVGSEADTFADEVIFETFGENLPLALCAAALKARALASEPAHQEKQP